MSYSTLSNTLSQDILSKIEKERAACLRSVLSQIEEAITPIVDRSLGFWTQVGGAFYVTEKKAFYVRSSASISSTMIQVMSITDEGESLDDVIPFDDFLANPCNLLAKEALLRRITELVWLSDNVLDVAWDSGENDEEEEKEEKDDDIDKMLAKLVA
jgi:hypothetical protein